MGIWHRVQPFLFRIGEERAHSLVRCALKYPFFIKKEFKDKALSVSIAGLNFSNPLGIAAGFDKNADVPNGILRLGFGFTEIGTLTPLSQLGNPSPRCFRLPRDKALINRMGFNNQGYDAAYKRLVVRKKKGILGINIGANKNSEDRFADYVRGIESLYEVSDYFTLNVSSPNTQGLRDLQEIANLRSLLPLVIEARDRQMQIFNRFVPVFLKISPDLTEKELDSLAAEILYSKLDGLVISNTTISRTDLKESFSNEIGGLSGAPLFRQSTIILAKMRKRLGKNYPIIGVGGIMDPITALEKIKAGADLLQCYTGLIYNGPFMVQEILESFIMTCRRDSIENITVYRDKNMQKWASQNIE
ncbi:MAG: dihydroorotate dehydrogenase [Candidatus Tokpelaia sp. JSC161]|jgi:dihydroorotate dehydrogenase|nr:MAG: dihydroorotate dehydrogenase [Candidatus Tokpelaia sp. JSC161]